MLLYESLNHTIAYNKDLSHFPEPIHNLYENIEYISLDAWSSLRWDVVLWSALVFAPGGHFIDHYENEK